NEISELKFALHHKIGFFSHPRFGSTILSENIEIHKLGCHRPSPTDGWRAYDDTKNDSSR
ncbi:MAG: hypothetical protein KKG06_10180, partial [Bacteroidetes bacterium]|nr:hypothetical protein [Bacteroidota bacterium]